MYLNIILIIISVSSSLVTFNTLQSKYFDFNKIYYDNKEDIIKKIKNENESIYFLQGDDEIKVVTFIQYFLLDKPLKFIYKNQVEDYNKIITEKDYLITDYLSEDILKNYKQDYFLNGLFYLKPSKNVDDYFSINPLEIYPLVHNNVFKAKNSVTSNRKENFLLYGPDIVLEKGNYNILIDIKIHEMPNTNENNDLFNLSIASKYPDKEYYSNTIKLNDLEKKDDSNYTLTLPLDIMQKAANTNFYLKNSSNVIIEIKDFKIAYKTASK